MPRKSSIQNTAPVSQIPEGMMGIGAALHSFNKILKEEISPKTDLKKLLHSYQDRPADFIQDILKTFLTDDMRKVCEEFVVTPALAVQSANAVGKTHLAAAIAVYFYLCYDDSQVYTACAPPEENLKRMLWGEIESIVKKNPHLFEGHDVKLASMWISDPKSDKSSFITGVSIPTQGSEKNQEARFSGKHAPYLLFIIDESDAVPRAVFNGIDSCVSGGMTRSLFLFNPRERSSEVSLRQQQGRVKTVKVTALSHPNVIEGDNIIPGAVTRNATAMRILDWTRPIGLNEKLTSKETDVFDVPDFLVGFQPIGNNGELYPPLKKEKRRIVEASFFYMVLAEYPTITEEQLIDADWVARAKSNFLIFRQRNPDLQIPKGIKARIGFDPADSKDLNVIAVRLGNILLPLYVSLGDALEAADYLVEEVLPNVSHEAITIDATGVGATVPKYLIKNKQINNVYGLKVGSTSFVSSDLGEFYSKRDEGWWALREWLRNSPNAMLPADDEDLERELLAAKWFKRNGKIKIIDNDRFRSALGGKSPDRASAVMMTFCTSEEMSRGKYGRSNYAGFDEEPKRNLRKHERVLNA